MKFDDSVIRGLKDRISISDLIGQWVSFDAKKSTDGDQWGCCPFHSESTPSFHAVDVEGYFKCFGCGEKGDHLEFLQKYHSCDFGRAVEMLADAAGEPLSRSDSQPSISNNSPKAEQPKQKSSSKPEGKRTSVKGYHYHDADGHVIYDVVRFQFKLPDGSWELDPKTGNPKKTFLQRQADGKGGHVWNLKGLSHTIFRHHLVEQAVERDETIFIVEGEKDAESLVDLELCGTTNSGGVQNFKENLARLFSGADVVILIDNDDPGRKAGEVKAQLLVPFAKRVRVLDFAKHVDDFPPKADVTDWLQKFGGSKDKLIEIIQSLPAWKPAPPKSRFGAVSLRDVDKESQKHEWLVQDMIELGGSAAFAGFSQSGKSFMMIELAFCVATGKPFWGRDVKQGLVIYQTGEGDKGFMKRVKGYMQDRELSNPDDVPIEILPKKINLFESDNDTSALIEECNAWARYHRQPLRMIVIDTFNKATRGANEISGLDMGKVIDRIERIAEKCQCTVMVVDHLSSQGRFRGHGSKTGDLTNVIKVEMAGREDENNRKVRRLVLDKNKDGENGGSIPFVLRQVVVGHDAEQRVITTCVVDAPDGDEPALDKTGRLSPNQAMLMQNLKTVLDRDGFPPPSGVSGVPKDKNVVKFADLVQEMKRKWVFDEAIQTDEQRSSKVFSILKSTGTILQKNGYIDRDNEHKVIWSTGRYERSFYKQPPTEVGTMPANIQAELDGAELAL